MAVAQEQEMVAEIQAMRAKVVEAEAQVPLAMAEAFRNGNLGVNTFTNTSNNSFLTGAANQTVNISPHRNSRL